MLEKVVLPVLGAVVGHLAAQFIDPTAVGSSQTVQFASLVSGIAVAITGQDAAAINIAAGAGANAAANNWLQPKEQELRRQAQRACDSSAAANARACGIVDALNRLDAAREAGNSGTLYKGMTSAIIGLLMSPVTALTALINSIVESGISETAVGVLKGIALLPTDIALDLQSNNPEVRGRGLVNALSTAVGTVALARNGIVAWQGAASDAWALEAAISPYRNTGLSQAARAWDKHDTSRDGGSYPPLTGNLVAKNEAAAQFVLSVIKDPGVVITRLSRGGTEYRLPNGQGFRLKITAPSTWLILRGKL